MLYVIILFVKCIYTKYDLKNKKHEPYFFYSTKLAAALQGGHYNCMWACSVTSMCEFLQNRYTLQSLLSRNDIQACSCFEWICQNGLIKEYALSFLHLGDTHSETIEKIRAFGNEALSTMHIKERHSHFKDGETSV